MRFGYNTNGFAHHRLEDTLTVLTELGYQSVAITLDHHVLNPFASDLSSRVAAVRDRLRSLGLHSVIETGARFLLDPRRKHQPTLISTEPQGRRLRLDFLRGAVDIASALGSDAVSFWSGAPDSPTTDAVLWERLTEGCGQLWAYAASRGVRMAFEPEPGMFIDTMAKFVELSRQVSHPAFGLTLDIGHLHCQGDLPIAEHVQRHRDRLWNVHIEDMRRGIHDHLMFGEGEIDFGEVLPALVDAGYAGGVHVELSRHSHDAVNVARRALAFLQSFSRDLPASALAPRSPEARGKTRPNRFCGKSRGSWRSSRWPWWRRL
jgi:sugar phosphate isomerase/epimerase